MHLITGPSSAFEKWSGLEISKTFYECRRHEVGESTRGGIPPLVRGGVRGITPEKSGPALKYQKRFTSAEGTKWGRAREGVFPLS